MIAGSALFAFSAQETPIPPSEDRTGETTRAEAVVNLIRSNPERGAAALFDAYSAEVNQLIWRLLGADPDHDDFVQHVFFTVIAQIETLRDPSKLRHWVQSVTVNTVYGELRKRQVRRLFLARQPAEQRLGDLNRDVEARDLLQRARRLLSRLPAKEQLVFLLHHIEGYTLLEVSELAGFSLATAKRRLSSANARFRKMVRRETGLELVYNTNSTEHV